MFNFRPAAPFSLTGDPVDMSTFSGRCMFYVGVINPRRMFYGEATISAALKKLADFEKKVKVDPQAALRLSACENDELWEARATKESCVHPVTGTIFPMFRFNSFIPVSLVIIPLIIHPKVVGSVYGTIAAHWLNQSYNVALNYANRSSDAVSVSSLMKAYAAAVAGSVSVALSGTFLMRRAVQKLSQASMAIHFIRFFVPALACAVAGAANVALTRKAEWVDVGVNVEDVNTGAVVGKSLVAGRFSVGTSAIARFLWSFAVILPGAVILPFVRMGCPRIFDKQVGRVGVEMMLGLVGMTCGVPPSMAVFPPRLTWSVDMLEPELAKSLKMRNIAKVTFYKGL